MAIDPNARIDPDVMDVLVVLEADFQAKSDALDARLALLEGTAVPTVPGVTSYTVEHEDGSVKEYEIV